MYEKRKNGLHPSVIPFCSEIEMGKKFRITGAVTVRKIVAGSGDRVMQCGFLRMGLGSEPQERPDEDEEETGDLDEDEICGAGPEGVFDRSKAGGPSAGHAGDMEVHRQDWGA